MFEENYFIKEYCYTRQEFISTFGTDDWFTIHVSHETFSLSLVDCLNCTMHALILDLEMIEHSFGMMTQDRYWSRLLLKLLGPVPVEHFGWNLLSNLNNHQKFWNLIAASPSNVLQFFYKYSLQAYYSATQFLNNEDIRISERWNNLNFYSPRGTNSIDRKF